VNVARPQFCGHAVSLGLRQAVRLVVLLHQADPRRDVVLPIITACGDAAHSIAKLNKRTRALLCGARASFTAFPRAARRVQEISLSM
jgi:hypothetical protein